MSNYDKTLEHALDNGLNVLLSGKHGVGKTAIIKSLFEERGLKWRYFSASTMDPWVDFIGVPKEKTNPQTGESHLELVRPLDFANDDVEALFFDELNRSHKKIRNAIMELIQFGSINGKEFKNLKVVWAAINPDDDEEAAYDVDKLDPAQLDRFHLHIDVPYKPDAKFFKKTYGEKGEMAVRWWNEQNKKTQDAISPRRLDYAVQQFISQGDIRYVLRGEGVNPKSFVDMLSRGNPVRDLEQLLNKSDDEKRAFFSDHNEFKRVQPDMVREERFLEAFAHLLPEEEILTSCRTTRNRRNKIGKYIAANPGKFSKLVDVVLSNKAAYDREVVASFDRYQRENSKSSDKKAESTDGTTTTAGRGSTILEIDGKKCRSDQVRICFTGTLTNYTREQASELITSFGAYVHTSVGYGTTHLVEAKNGRVAQRKLAQAKSLGVTIISEQEFLDAFVNRPATQQLNNQQDSVDNKAGAKDITVVDRDFDGKPTVLEINGKIYQTDGLTCDNFLSVTGRRYRATSHDLSRIARGEATREECFINWINSL